MGCPIRLVTPQPQSLSCRLDFKPKLPNTLFLSSSSLLLLCFSLSQISRERKVLNLSYLCDKNHFSLYPSIEKSPQNPSLSNFHFRETKKDWINQSEICNLQPPRFDLFIYLCLLTGLSTKSILSSAWAF